MFNDERQDFLVNLSHGPLTVVECFSGYKVNGYRFHTKARNEGKATYNCGVCVKGVGEGDEVSGDYYGVLHEIVRVEFTGEPIKKCVLFNCEWFDPDVPRGLRYPKFTPYPEVNHTRRYRKYDPFIFADVATQVVYVKYSEGISGKANWWVAIPNKPRGAPKDKENLELAYQQFGMTNMNVDNVIVGTLVDETAEADDVDEHDWGDDDDGNGEHDDGDEEDEEGEWEDEEEDTDEGHDENTAVQSGDDDDDDDNASNHD